ncbi:MAG: MarC family NAAT transporter [Enterobacterales bacterium]
MFVSLLEAVGSNLMMLLPLVNPLATVAIFLSLSKNFTENQRNNQALMSSIYAFIIMMIAFFAGTSVMNLFGISIVGLRIAGGMIVACIGFQMLFPSEINNKNSNNKYKNTNIAFVPLAIPSISGPGTISMIISTVSSMDNYKTKFYFHMLTFILVFFIISFIVWIVLRGSSIIMNFIGHNGVEAVSRCMGFLLVCMGIQFVINGILEIVHH